MAQSFLTPINMNKLEIQNLRLQNLASAPGSPVAGQIYYDSGTNKAYFYNGSAWVPMDGSSGGGVLTSDFSSNNSILKADTAGSPTALAVSADSLIGRATGVASGVITSLSATQVRTLLSLSDSQIKQLAGAMVTGNTETGITVTYQSADDTIDFVVGTLDSLPAPTASLSLNSQKITNLSDPTSAQDAATKAYVDATATGLDVKASVRVASTSNVTISSPGASIDGVTLTSGDRVLLAGQSTGSQNGIYVFNGAASAMTRATDADSNAEVTSGMYTFVEEGTNASNGYILTTANPITVGSTTLSFTQFTGAGQITAGAGLTKTGNTLNVGAGTGITVNADDIQISASYVGQTSITTLGTIATGTWNATTIAVNKGGTGATTLTSNGVLLGNGTSAVTATTAGSAYNVLRVPSGGGAPAFGAIDISQTAAVTGTLAATNGGTGQSTVTTGDLLYGSASNVWSKLAGVATGNALISGGVSTAPSWGKIGLTTHISGTLAVGNGGTGATTLTSNGVLLGAGTSAVTATSAGSADQVLRIPGAGGAPAFGAIDLTKSAAVTGALPIANGGTGQTTASAALTALGGVAKYSANIGDGTTTAITVTHNLGTRDVQIQVYDATTYDTVYPDMVRTTTTTATITFAVAPTTNQYRVVIQG